MGLNPFQYLKYWIISLFSLKWGIMKTGRLPCSSPWKAKQYTLWCQMQRMYAVGQSMNTLKEHNSTADPYSHSQKQALTTDLRHNEWVASYACLWAHSGERQQWEDDDCLRETIFPIPSFMGHTLSTVMVWVEEFFPCTHRLLCSNKSGTVFLHPLLKDAKNL